MDSQTNKTVEIEGETWRATLTPAEYEAWKIYGDRHEFLLNQIYEATLRMFLTHYRNGINLNDPLKP